jgi:excisionase family DNA binding protein
MMIPEPMLTPKQVAELLNVSTKHVRRLFSSGRIVPVDVGIGRRSLRVTRAEIDRYIEGAKPATPAARRRKYSPKVL